MISAVLQPNPVEREWSARLALEYVLQGNETVLTKRSHEGPLRVQRPFLEASGVCQTYVIHPPGGIVGGDTLDVGVSVHAGARALVTTPGATKFYRSGGARARQTQRISVSRGASMEWLPQETIVFDAADASTATFIQLEDTSKCVLWDITCLGRPASEQPFASGRFAQRLEVYADGRPLILESLRCENAVGRDQALTARWGFQGFPVYGTMVIHPLPPEALSAVRGSVEGAWKQDSSHRFGASHLPFSERESTIVCRYLGSSADYCKRLFAAVWCAARPLLLGIPAEPPRVWRT